MRAMRTVETQEKNLHTARAYAWYNVSKAIHASEHSEQDKETMLAIINSTYNKDAKLRYWRADARVREALQDIIEVTYYGRKQVGNRLCPKCGTAYSEPPALSREDGETEICPDCGMREALSAFLLGAGKKVTTVYVGND